MKRLKLRRYPPLPVLEQHGPYDPPIVKVLRDLGLRCLGPYHNDRWYIFISNPRTKPTNKSDAKADARKD
jgi:hypothetical protein